MTAQWPRVELDQLTEYDRRITYGVVKPGGEIENGVKFVRGGDIFQGQITLDNLRTISPELSRVYKRTILKGGELLISLVGNPGEVAIAPASLEGANIARQVGMIALLLDVESRFVMYFFMSPEGRAELFTRTGGAVQQVINLAELKNIKIPVPPLSQQRQIATILSNYDDLIENNRRRMMLLEESARLLYREWFVRLRFPGHEHTRIVDGVPEGWERGCVSDFYETSSGGTPSRTNPDFFTGEVLWVKTQELLNGFITDTEEKITEDALKRSAAKLFPEKTVLVAMYGATIGQIGIIASHAASNQACCAIIAKDARANFVHAFLFFRENKEKLVSLSMGAAQNNINQQIIRSFPMVMPSRRLMAIFCEALNPVFAQWLNLYRQNQKLRSARDLLLPKLMGGEIEV